MNTKLNKVPIACSSQTSTKRSSFRCAVSLLCILAVGGLSVNGISAQAADPGQGSVDVGGEHVLTIYYPSGGLSVKQRADKVTERLVTILGDPSIKPADIQAMPFGSKEARIMVKNKLLYTVDVQTAKRDSTTPMKLAQTYVTHLRDLLPRINVKPNPNGP